MAATWKASKIHPQPAELHWECWLETDAGAAALIKNKKRFFKSPLTATMCSRTAPLFRSWLVKRSWGNSCIAEERENVRVTTHQQHDGEVTCPHPTPRGLCDFTMGGGVRGAGPGCPVGSAGSRWISVVVVPMGVLLLLFLLHLFSLDYLIQSCIPKKKTGHRSQKGSDAN